MRRVFADTGYWVALLNPRDQLHQKARGLSKTMGSLYIFTSEMVLEEVLNDFSKKGYCCTNKDKIKNGASPIVFLLR